MKTMTVQAVVKAPLEKTWECWTGPEHITGWAFASDEWESPVAENDLQTGGTFRTRMQAKDGSSGFDFEGTYTAVKQHELIEYEMSDGRWVKVAFENVPDGVRVTETFDLEQEHSEEMQRSGWQAILDNFKKYVETK